MGTIENNILFIIKRKIMETVKLVNTVDKVKFEQDVQNLLNEGYELSSTSCTPVDSYPNYVAILTKAEEVK